MEIGSCDVWLWTVSVELIPHINGTLDTPHPSVLVGMLEAGEPQFFGSVQSVREQVAVDASLLIIRGLSNVDAHQTLYAAFMANSVGADWMLKLDADMLLNRPTAIREAIDSVMAADAQHGIFSVQDHLSGERVLGVHIFASGLRWSTSREEVLFTDPDPVSPHRQIIVEAEPAPFVDHCPNPSDYQAASFGFHRGLKIRQLGRLGVDYRCGTSRRHVKTFVCMARHFQNEVDQSTPRAHLLVLAGATEGLTARTGQADYRSEDSMKRLAEITSLSNQGLLSQLSHSWRSQRYVLRLNLSVTVRCGRMYLHKMLNRLVKRFVSWDPGRRFAAIGRTPDLKVGPAHASVPIIDAGSVHHQERDRERDQSSD